MKFSRISSRVHLLLVACALFILPQAAQAYVGPGLGLGAIAVVIGVVGSVLLAVFALFWYPIKRMFKKNKPGAKDASPHDAGE